MTCCNLTYRSRKYNVKPYKPNCVSEEYEKITCAKCGTLKVDLKRKIIRPNKKEFSYIKHLKGESARAYLFTLDYDKREVTEIFDPRVQTGSKTGINLFYGINNSIKNFNDKTVGSRVTNPINTIKGDFTPAIEKQVLTA